MLSRCSQIKVILAQSSGNLLYSSDQIFAIRWFICFTCPIRHKGSFAGFIMRAEKGDKHRFITRDIQTYSVCHKGTCLLSVRFPASAFQIS